MSETSQTSPDDLTAQIYALREELSDMRGKFDSLVQSHNSVGENVAWLVANVQGIFQMFNDPKMMAQLMGKMVGGGVASE